MKLHRRQKNLLRHLRLPFEWIGIGLGYLVFAFLPFRALLAVCDFASAVMYFFDRGGRRLALCNLRIIENSKRSLEPAATNSQFSILINSQFDPTSRESKIIRRSYRNMSRTIGYAFWTCRRAKARARRAGVMSDEGKAFLAANKPAITVSGHMGCWEILSQLAFLEGHAMMSVAKDIGTSAMTKLLMKARRSIGQEIVHADGAFRPLMQGLKDGRSLGLLVDQVVKPKNGGIWVYFLGRPMPVSAAPAFFSAKGKAPIAVAWSRPLKDGRWRCEVLAEYPCSAARDVWGMTQRCLKDLERVIKRHPSCWVLNYRYFRKIPTMEELTKLNAKCGMVKSQEKTKN